MYRVHPAMNGVQTDYTGSCKSNYHTITTTMTPLLQGILRCYTILLRLLFVVFFKSVVYLFQVRVVQEKEPVHFMSILLTAR